MKEILTSFAGKRLDVTFKEGNVHIRLRPTSSPKYPYYQILEVGVDAFKMTHIASDHSPLGVANYYRIDKVMEIGPT